MSFIEDIEQLVAANSGGVLSCATGWRRKPLGTLARVINGFAFQSKYFNSDSGTPLARIRDVVRGRSNTLYKGPVPEGYDVRDGDLLIGMDGDFNCALWRGGDALLNQRVCRIDNDEAQVRRKYLSYVLPGYLKLINDYTSSLTVKHLSSRTLQLLPIPIPPSDEQDRLVARIDALFGEIDNGERELAQAREGVGIYRRALLKAAVIGELTANWRRENPPQETGADLLRRILADRRARWKADTRNVGKKYKEPAKPEFESLPLLPEGWAWATADMLSDAGKGHIIIGPFGSDLKVTDYSSEGVPLVFVRHIRAGVYDELKPQFISVEKAHDLRAHVVRAGDILVTKMGDPPGDADIYPSDQPDAVITADCVRWRVAERVDRGFCLSWINSILGRHWIRRMTKGVAQQKISLDIFKQIPVPVPSSQEAAIAVEMISSNATVYEDQLSSVQRSIDQAAALRQSILAAAFRGELCA